MIEDEAGVAAEVEKRVTWAELLFDLVFVFAITQLSGLLHHDHSWAGVARTLIAFVPIYWAWVGTSIHANTHDVDRALDRIGVFGVALCALFMALAAPLAYEEHGVLFAASYLVARVILAALVFRGTTIALNPFSVAVFVSGPLLLAGGFTHGTARILLWALAAAVDLSTPRLLRGRLLHLRFDPSHLPERFGLFLIIALGESVVATGAPAAEGREIGAGVMGAVAGSFVLICGLWWVYYHFGASAIRHALTTAEVQSDVVRQVLSYGHLSFIAGIVALASALAEVVEHPGDHLRLDIAALLFGGCALYLATFGYTRWRMFRLWSVYRLSAAGVILALLPLAPLVPALAALYALAAVVIALNAVEYAVVRARNAL